MDGRKEIIVLPWDFPFDIFKISGVNDQSPELHFHDCLEINFIEDGTGTNIIGDKKYRLVKGDFYIINNLEHHMGFSDGNLQMLVIIFDPVFIWQNNLMDYEYLKPFFSRSTCFSNLIGKEDSQYDELVLITRKIYEEWMNKQEGYRLVIKAKLMELLAILYRHYQSGDDHGVDAGDFWKSFERIRRVLEYMNKNFKENLTLDELARVALMNRTYFSTYFKKTMKMNVSYYLEVLRVAEACRLLKTSYGSVTSIAAESGFNSVSYFNKVFKKHMQVSPNEFREKQNIF